MNDPINLIDPSGFDQCDPDRPAGCFERGPDYSAYDLTKTFSVTPAEFIMKLGELCGGENGPPICQDLADTVVAQAFENDVHSIKDLEYKLFTAIWRGVYRDKMSVAEERLRLANARVSPAFRNSYGSIIRRTMQSEKARALFAAEAALKKVDQYFSHGTETATSHFISSQVPAQVRYALATILSSPLGDSIREGMNNTGEKIDIIFATGSALPWEAAENEIYYHPDLSFSCFFVS